MSVKQTKYTFSALIEQAKKEVKELFPWDVEELMDNKENFLIVDIREPYEYKKMRIEKALNVPRGILESACDWSYDETIPTLVKARDKKVIVVCRSGNRSILAAQTMQWMGYKDVYSLQTGLKGWNEYDLPLIDDQGEVDVELADEYHQAHVSEEQMEPSF